MTTPNDDLTHLGTLELGIRDRIAQERQKAYLEGWKAGQQEGFAAASRMFISVPANIEVEADIDGECHCWLCCGSKKDYEEVA